MLLLDPDKPHTTQSVLLMICALAVAYLLVGELGLLMAIAPGFASPVWPAAGVALGALLLAGYRVWPGVLIGSFVLNLPGSIGLSLGGENVGAILVAAGIATGSSLQALAGAWLIRRHVEFQAGLLDARSVIIFLGLGGPVGSLVSASLGVSTLFMSGAIDTTELAYSWITWWSGDCLGVLFMLPLIFIFFAKPRSFWEPRKIRVALPLFVCIASVVVVFMVASGQQQQQIVTRFDSQASMLGNSLLKKTTQNFEVLYSLEQLFINAPAVNRDQFKRYVERALARNPSISALSWNPQLMQHDRDSFENTMRAQGYDNFSIKDRSDDGRMIPAAQRDSYLVVQFIEPLEENEKVLGYDITSNPVRKVAVEQARLSGKLTATAPIDLVQQFKSQVGVLFLLPVYQASFDAQTQPPQEKILEGIVVGVFRTGSLLLKALEDTGLANVNLRLTDITDADDPRRLASFRLIDGEAVLVSDESESASLGGLLDWQKTMQFGNRNWLLEVFAPPAYFTQNRSWTAWGILFVGLLFAALLGCFLMILSGRTILDWQRADDLRAQIIEREKIEAALKQANESLHKIAGTDMLTQIANRRATETYAAMLDAEVQRYRTGYSVLMLDIDHFKVVNDLWGHSVGDQVLQEFVARIGTKLRDVDFLGRWGGEEFVILAKNTPLPEACDFAERICSIISQQHFTPGGLITTSIGVATYQEGETYAEVILRADRALYKAKHNGRNCVESEEQSNQPALSRRSASS